MLALVLRRGTAGIKGVGGKIGIGVETVGGQLNC